MGVFSASRNWWPQAWKYLLRIPTSMVRTQRPELALALVTLSPETATHSILFRLSVHYLTTSPESRSTKCITLSLTQQQARRTLSVKWVNPQSCPCLPSSPGHCPLHTAATYQPCKGKAVPAIPAHRNVVRRTFKKTPLPFPATAAFCHLMTVELPCSCL